MIIAQISDTHIALDTEDSVKRIEDFERVVSDINSLDQQPDLVVHTGDVVHNGRPDEYSCAASILNKLKKPTFVMVGNKDDRTNLRAAFGHTPYLKDADPFIAYAVEEFPVRLIMLDTLNPKSNRGDFCEVRFRHLKEMLAADQSRPSLLFAHHPPFIVPVGPDPCHFGTEDLMHRLANVASGSSNVVGLICGHVHRGVTGFIRDVPVPVMPSVATTLRRGEYPQHVKNRPLYHLHHYSVEMGLSTSARIV